MARASGALWGVMRQECTLSRVQDQAPFDVGAVDIGVDSRGMMGFPVSLRRVELLYFPGCPHVQAARVQLTRAMLRVGLSPQWVEHDVTAHHAPRHTQGHGSPTILIDGRDVCGASPVAGTACRFYP